MEDLGFSGAGSRSNSRFEAGSPIQAKQLNDLAAGLQTGQPMPYLGEGPVVSFTPGGSLITGVWDNNVVGASPICPLQIYNLRYDVDADVYYINVSPGMVNNLGVQDYDDNPLTDVPPPNIQVFVSGITTEFTTNYIYIACDNSGSPDFKYPDPDVPPYLWIKDAPDTSDDDTGLILIGIVKGKTSEDQKTDTLETYNYKACGSLWTERFQCGDSTANYWWSGV